MSESMVQIFEGIMLVCFGISWPIDILHTLRLRNASGKSLLFMALIILGYLMGVASKFIRSHVGDQPLEPVTWLYAFNAVLVLADLVISGYFQKKYKGNKTT